jgi:hypothetical protein
MKTTRFLVVLTTLAVAVLAASNAWAAGESKNQSPFNRRTDERQKPVLVDTKLSATSGAGPHRAAATSAEIAPDWFERYASAHPYGIAVQAAADTRGEPKDDAPFDRSTSVNTTSPRSTASGASHPLTATSAPFHWRDAGIGASLATLLLCVAAAGAAHLRPSRTVGA